MDLDDKMRKVGDKYVCYEPKPTFGIKGRQHNFFGVFAPARYQIDLDRYLEEQVNRPKRIVKWVLIGVAVVAGIALLYWLIANGKSDFNDFVF